jgi:tryptophan 2-monooxygenase
MISIYYDILMIGVEAFIIIQLLSKRTKIQIIQKILSIMRAATLPEDDQSPILLICGNMWDGHADEPLGPVEILVEDGKIAQIGKTLTRPAGAKIVDLAGHTITPGFIDCHVHTTIDPKHPIESILNYSDVSKALFALGPLRDLLMNGFTSVRDAAGFDHGYVTVDLKRAIEQGLIVGPKMFVAPHLISSTGGHGDMADLMALEYAVGMSGKIVADGPDEITRVVREEIRGGADWIKFCGSGGFGDPTVDPSQTTYTQEEMNALVKAAHDYGISVCTHVYGTEGVRRAVAAGVDSIEHGSLSSPEDLALMEKNGIFLVPTLHTIFPDLDRLGDPDYLASVPAFLAEKYSKYADVLRAKAKNLAKSNVKVAFGTDAGTFPFKDNWREFLDMVKIGFTALRALKAATSIAAEMLKRPDLGTLAAGKTADIIAMPGDPFRDINITGNVDFVMKEGLIYKWPAL